MPDCTMALHASLQDGLSQKSQNPPSSLNPKTWVVIPSLCMSALATARERRTTRSLRTLLQGLQADRLASLQTLHARPALHLAATKCWPGS